MLSRLNEFLLFFAALSSFLAAIGIGFWLGCRHRAGSDEVLRDHIKALQAALLGLLSLLLGFNFAMASSRFDARKALIQEEVDTLGTTWLRAQLLTPARQQETTPLLQAYITARIDSMLAGTNEARMDAANAEASAVEAQLWSLTRTMVTDGTAGPQPGLFIQSFNDMVNVKWKRRAALDNHVPEPVLYLLCTVAAGALGFIGYHSGLTGQRRQGATAVYALLIALIFATILDFDRPRGGFIRVSEEGLLRLQATFAKPPPVPR